MNLDESKEKNDVTEAGEVGQALPSRRKRRQSPKRRRTLGHFWANWRVEIVIGLVVLLAIFLLVERMQIRQTLFGWLRAGLQGLAGLFQAAAGGLARFVQTTTLSDLIGYTLLLAAMVVVLWRIRWRLMKAPSLTGSKCPACGRKLQRIHRRWYDRLLNIYLPVRRYRCDAPTCDWSGLRTGHNRS